MDIDTNPANYEPNSINDSWPRETPPAPKLRRLRDHTEERVDGNTEIANAAPLSVNKPAILACSAQSDADRTAAHIVTRSALNWAKVARAYIFGERVVDQLSAY